MKFWQAAGPRSGVAPVGRPSPCIILSTPGGSFAASAASMSSALERGAHSGGLMMQVLPEARAGPSFQVVSISGAFQGVMIAHTPAGSCRT